MKHWVFDLDGTLVDSFPIYFRTLEVVFGKYGARFTPELRHAAVTDSMPEFFARHVPLANVTEAMALLTVRCDADAEHVKPYDGIMELLEDLKARGHGIAVWTNRDLSSAELILKHTGIERHIELCVSGSCVPRRKPHADGMTPITKQLQCVASDITMVGDHDHDVLAARAAGARPVRVSWNDHSAQEPCPHSHAQFYTVLEFARWAIGK